MVLAACGVSKALRTTIFATSSVLNIGPCLHGLPTRLTWLGEVTNLRITIASLRTVLARTFTQSRGKNLKSFTTLLTNHIYHRFLVYRSFPTLAAC
jgi:hypothetical protein